MTEKAITWSRKEPSLWMIQMGGIFVLSLTLDLAHFSWKDTTSWNLNDLSRECTGKQFLISIRRSKGIRDTWPEHSCLTFPQKTRPVRNVSILSPFPQKTRPVHSVSLSRRRQDLCILSHFPAEGNHTLYVRQWSTPVNEMVQKTRATYLSGSNSLAKSVICSHPWTTSQSTGWSHEPDEIREFLTGQGKNSWKGTVVWIWEFIKWLGVLYS